MADTWNIILENTGAGVTSRVIRKTIQLSTAQGVALEHFLNRIESGALTANQTAGLEKLIVAQAKGLTSSVDAALVTLGNAVLAGTNVSTVVTAINAL